MKAHVASDLKIYNRMILYDLVKTEGEISKADISRRLKLSAPTVIKIVDYFSSLGLIGEAGEGEAPLGRKPMLLDFRPMAAYSIGAEFDGVHLNVGLVDLGGRIEFIRRSPAPPDLGLLFGNLLENEVDALVAESGVERDRIKGLGVGVPGVVHADDHFIGQAPLVGVDKTVDYAPLVSGLQSRLGLPVVVSNDANAAVLGELAARGGSCGGDLIFVELGRGVGAGLVLDGMLRQGPAFSAGEIGYMVLDRKAAAVYGGAGWLESAMDLDGFWAEIERKGAPSQEAIARVGSLLALGLANLCVALDVRTVVLGRAEKENFGPALLATVRDEIRRLCPMEIRCECPVDPDPGVAGVAGLALEAWLKTMFAG